MAATDTVEIIDATVPYVYKKPCYSNSNSNSSYYYALPTK